MLQWSSIPPDNVERGGVSAGSGSGFNLPEKGSTDALRELFSCEVGSRGLSGALATRLHSTKKGPC
jgi:hypothetical protein